MFGGPVLFDGCARLVTAAVLGLSALACSSGVDGYRIGGSSGSGSGAISVDASGGHASNGGGAAGKATGGATNSGGAGGVGSGGTGAGGASGAGGTTPGKPISVPLNDPPTLGGITAAAWAAPYFFLLEAGAHQFWRVDPGERSVDGPFMLPDVAVFPHAFAASSDSVYVVAGDNVYRVPHAGSSTTPGASLVTKGLANPSAAYAKGYLLIGDASKSAGAQVFRDDPGMVSAASLGKIYTVASDGSNFAFTTLDTGGNLMRLHDVPSSGTMSPNTAPCFGGNVASAANYPVSVHGQTLAWVLPASANKLLFFATVTDGTCPKNPPDQVIFGADAAGPNVVALTDENHALIVDSYGAGSGKVSIVGRFGGKTDAVTVTLGGRQFPSAIVVGGQHYAVLVNDNKPAVIGF